MMQARIETSDEGCEKSSFGFGPCLCRELGACSLCSVEGSHPLEQPRIRFVMASDLEVDQHAATQQCGAMLKALLASTRCGGKRCKAEAL
jgi:hypothetical protein